jgi:hypothetical protein
VASLLRGKLYNARKQSDTERASEGGKAKAAKCQIGIKQETTAAVVATETGVSERTVKRDAKFAERVEALGIEAEVSNPNSSLRRAVCYPLHYGSEGWGESVVARPQVNLFVDAGDH